MSKIVSTQDLGNTRVLFLDAELPQSMPQSVLIGNESFDIIYAHCRNGYMRNVIGVTADKEKFPDSFFIGKDVA